jgi:putative mRNA 3-end processing factor
VLSDHADWPALNECIKETGSQRIFTTHGYTDIFARWLIEQGYDARAVSTEFIGEDMDAVDNIE